MILVLVMIGGILYFLPTFGGMIRRVEAILGIFILNLFLGWTFFGWVGALIWASVGAKRKDEPIPEPISEDEAQRLSRLGIDL